MPTTEIRLPRGRRPVPTHTRLRTRRVPLAAYVTALILLPALVVVGSISAGWWSTTGRALTADSGGRAGAALTGRTGAPTAATESATVAAPADVRGSTTVAQVVAAFPAVSVADVLTAFGAPAGTPPSVQLKTLVETGGVMELPAFRIWLEGHRTP